MHFLWGLRLWERTKNYGEALHSQTSSQKAGLALEQTQKRTLNKLFYGSFTEDLATLEQIPIVPALLSSDEIECADLDMTNNVENAPEKDLSVSQKKPKTLLEWISATDRSCMEQLYKNCKKGLEEVHAPIVTRVLHC